MSEAANKRADERADERAGELAYERTNGCAGKGAGELTYERANGRAGKGTGELAYERTGKGANELPCEHPYRRPYERVKLARDSKRPTGLDYIKNIFKGFMEFHGDRRYADDPAVVGGIAKLDDIPVTVIAIEKGHTAKERTYRNFGMPKPEGYRKALRLMKQAEKFGRPVVCFVDTSGAYCGIDAEERGQGQAIAENLLEMSTLCVPILSILIGEGGSGGALALAVADRVWMLQNAVYSVISPEGCASILWKDSSKAEAAAASLRLTAEDGKSLGVIERILSENDIGKKEFFERIRTLLTEELRELSCDMELTQKRYDRFRRLGTDAVSHQGIGAVSHQGAGSVSHQGAGAVSHQGSGAVSHQGSGTVSHQGAGTVSHQGTGAVIKE